MTSKTINRMILAAVLAGPLLVALLASPTLTAWAATKIIDIHVQNISTSSPFPDTSVCDIAGTFTENMHIGQFDLVVWDNGHVELKTTGVQSKIFDSTGNLVAKTHTFDIFAFKEGGLPLITEEDFIFTCTGGPTPGKQFNGHGGITIDENGNPHIH